MKTKLTPLPRRSRLLPGESLPSLLARLEALNYYTPGTIGWLCRRDAGGQMDNMMRPRLALTYVQLAALSGLGTAVLFAASDHRFAPVLTTSRQKQKYIILPSRDKRLLVNNYPRHTQIRSAHRVQFCPLCLQKAAYHRLAWAPTASAICLEHQCLLANQCSCCGKDVAIGEVVDAQCKACEADLRETPVVSTAGDDLGITSQRFLQFWLTTAPEPRDYILPQHSPAAWYRLVDGVRLSLAALPSDWSHLPDPLPAAPKLTQAGEDRQQVELLPLSSYRLYRAAFQAVLDWPQGFCDFLDAFRANAETSTTLTNIFGTLFTRWIQQAWRGPEFRFVQHAFADYLFSGQVPLVPVLHAGRFKNDVRLPEQRGLLNKKQAAQVLDVSEEVISNLAGTGRLRPARVPLDGGNILLLKLDKVLEIAHAWKKGLPMKDVQCWLGLPNHVIKKLLEMGLLKLAENSPNDHQNDWLFDKHSVESFAAAVVGRLELSMQAELVSLKQAVADWWNPPLDEATLLKMVIDGQLQGYNWPVSWHYNLSHVRLEKAELEKVFQVIIARHGWVSDEDVARQLRVSPNALFPLWYKYSVLYGLRVVAMFRVRPRYEIAYFKAETAQQFCSNCLGIEETARLLGMSRSTLMRNYVKTYRIVPLADPRHDGSRRYLFWRPLIEMRKG